MGEREEPGMFSTLSLCEHFEGVTTAFICRYGQKNLLEPELAARSGCLQAGKEIERKKRVGL